MLSRRKLPLELGLVCSALLRLSPLDPPGYKNAEPLEPGIGEGKSGTVSSCSFTALMVEPVASLERTKAARGGAGRSGSGLRWPAIEECLLASSESENHMLPLVLSVFSDSTVERWGFQRPRMLRSALRSGRALEVEIDCAHDPDVDGGRTTGYWTLMLLLETVRRPDFAGMEEIRRSSGDGHDDEVADTEDTGDDATKSSVDLFGAKFCGVNDETLDLDELGRMVLGKAE